MKNQDVSQLLEAGFPPEAELSYSDMHGLWGGVKVQIFGSRKVVAEVMPEPFKGGLSFSGTFTFIMTDVDAFALCRVLRECRVWLPLRTPSGSIHPDQVFCTVTFRATEAGPTYRHIIDSHHVEGNPIVAQVRSICRSWIQRERNGG